MDDFGDAHTVGQHSAFLVPVDHLSIGSVEKARRDGSHSLGGLHQGIIGHTSGHLDAVEAKDDFLGDLGAAIPDDFGDGLDEQIFADDLFTDEALKAVESVETEAPGAFDDADDLAGPTNPIAGHGDSFRIEPLDSNVVQGTR